MAQPASIAVELERIACDMHSLAFDVAEPARSISQSHRRTDEGERIAAALHAAGDQVRRMFRG